MGVAELVEAVALQDRLGGDVRRRRARLDPVQAGRRLANYLSVLTREAQIIARACGKSHLHNLEPEDLCALTLEAAAMTQIPMAGTNWYPGLS